MHTETRAPLDTLVDYLTQTLSRHPELLLFEPDEATLTDLEQWTDDELFIVDSIEQARFSVLLAETLADMSADCHAEEDQAVLGVPTRRQATVWKKEFGSLRKASSAMGIARTTLWRAIHQEAA